MAKQTLIKDSKRLYEFSNVYNRHNELEKSKQTVSDISEVTLGNYLYEFFARDWETTRDFLNAPISKHAKVIKEIVTGKRLKEAEANLKREQMLFDAANRMYQLTGNQPGEKSGVVKSGEIADKKVAELLHSIKISAAMVLAYGKDDAKKKQVMKEIENKYPEIAKEVRELAKKHKCVLKMIPLNKRLLD